MNNRRFILAAPGTQLVRFLGHDEEGNADVRSATVVGFWPAETPLVGVKLRGDRATRPFEYAPAIVSGPPFRPVLAPDADMADIGRTLAWGLEAADWTVDHLSGVIRVQGFADRYFWADEVRCVSEEDGPDYLPVPMPTIPDWLVNKSAKGGTFLPPNTRELIGRMNNYRELAEKIEYRLNERPGPFH